MTKWVYAVAATLAILASNVAALDQHEDGSEDGDARLGFITIGSGGTTSLAFNATSIQNAVILGLFLLVLGALIIPLFGAGTSESESYGYGYEQSSGYEEPAAHNGYSGYAKR